MNHWLMDDCEAILSDISMNASTYKLPMLPNYQFNQVTLYFIIIH